MLINPDRLASTFISLCEIDSPARKEGRLANHLKKLFKRMGADWIIEDESAALTGSDCGNLIIRFKGRGLPLEPIFFNCHMDVISPCDGVKVRFKDGLFSSRGETVLGGDDKGGLAILIEAMQALLDNEVPFGPVEFLFTTCEEIGLLGAKAFDADMLSAKIGYALDSTGIDVAITGAPAAKFVVAKISGLAAHAGLHPEQGISAIQIAAQAVGKLKLGLLDDESTANIGMISGGTATNIIPDHVELRGEVRSHSESKLQKHLEEIERTFSQVVEQWPVPEGIKQSPTLSFHTPDQYPLLNLHPDSSVMRRVSCASSSLARHIPFIRAGGGSDANILNSYGLETAILGIGMTDVHTTHETIRLDDMARTSELIISLLTS